MFVEESIHGEFGGAVIELADEQAVGYGLEKETDAGALIGPKHEHGSAEYVETGEREGAAFLHDGGVVTVDGYENGSFLGPTVFPDVTPGTEST